MTLPSIEHSILIEASRQRVWAVLTSEGLVEQWLGCIGFTGEIGSTFYMQPDSAKRAKGDVSGATHCELLQLDPPTSMTFSWFMPGTPKTEVEIRLDGEGDITTASLVHSGWDQFNDDDVRSIHGMLEGGWRSFVLPGLKRIAESYI